VVFQDIYGPTVAVKEIEALIVSGETRSGGRAVNEKRVEQGWPALEVYEVDVLDAEDKEEESKTENFAAKISSSAIRQQRAARGGTKI
jgi:phosphopantetheine adenylyltransferase